MGVSSKEFKKKIKVFRVGKEGEMLRGVEGWKGRRNIEGSMGNS